MNYDLMCEFDIDQHKKIYVNYLEIVIDKNGKCMYAVPSHQEKLVALTGIDREMLWRLIPVSADVLQVLTDMTECIAVWNDFYVGKLNEHQKSKLKSLKLHGLYRGKI